MHDTDKYMVSVEGSNVEIIRLYTEPVTNAVPCTFRNATDRTIYLWHWPQEGNLYDDPSFLQPVRIGESVTIFYPEAFYARATFGHDSLSNAIEELIVGQIPHHCVLLAPSPAYAS